MKAIIRKGDTLREEGGEVLDGHYLCDGLPIPAQIFLSDGAEPYTQNGRFE